MSKKKIIYAIILAIVVILIGLITKTIKTDDKPSARDEAMEADRSRPEITINVKHQYKDGEHVFVGTFDLPTPCHGHNAEIVDGEIPTIALTTIPPEENSACIQVIEEVAFKVSYMSDNPEQEFYGTLDGEPVVLNIFELGPNEDIDSLELYIKG